MHAAMRIVLGMALASMAACSGSSDERAAAVPAVSLETLTVAPTQVPRLREWDGRIEAIEQATLAAQTGGRVADLSVDVGDVVDEGQVLVRFTTVEQKAGQRQALADLEAARAAASEAATSFRRVQDIYARRLVAKSELDRAEAANDAAQAQLAAARAGLKRADEQVAVVPGQLVGDPTELGLADHLAGAVEDPPATRVDHQQPCLGVRDLVLKRLNGYFRFCLSLLVGGNLFGGDTSKF